jgi:hypothetical protein
MIEEDPNFFKPSMPSQSRGHSQEKGALRAARGLDAPDVARRRYV